jgi:hypothetical protein
MPFTTSCEPASRLVVAVWGDAKVGKTHFALTFPEPIRVLNLDFGLRELLHRFSPKDIAWSDLETTATSNLEESQRVLKAFHDDYLAAIEECQNGGTVVIDTATQLWQIIQTVKLHEVRARRGAAKGKSAEEVKPMGFDYAEANTLMGGLLRRVLHKPNLNACFIHRAKTKYNAAGERLDGVLEFQGYGETPAIAQITMQLTSPGFGRIDYCRFDAGLAGMEIGDLSYDELKGIVGA